MHPDFPPASAPLEVDRVEWVPASPEAVHVHLLGRWIDRPVAEPLILLVGTERRRYSFDALESPPPGVLVAFAVPNELRSRLSMDIALQIGAHELALPGASTGDVADGGEGPAAEEPEAEVIDRAVLAERRARRAEIAEETLNRRAEQAEKTAGTLEAQLANLEERLGQARDERDELEAGLADAERKLRGAQQREYAEQQLRIETQDELERVRRGQEGEVADLRRRLKAADQRTEEMAREVDRARRAIAEALQRAELGASEASNPDRAQLERALAEVQARAADLQASLGAERDARARAESALGATRDEWAAKVTLLEHELDSRVELQARIAEQLQAVRGELEQVRGQAADQDRIADLERRRDAAEAELAHAREGLAERSTELERARIDLARAHEDAELLRAQAREHEAALEQATRTIEIVRTSAGELQLRLDDERRERAQAEAALHEELARAQADGRRSLHDVEIELRMALETERRAFAEQVARIEGHVASLREQVAAAAGQLRETLDAERAARLAAERELADERDRVSTERTAASEALAQLALEQARREELETQVAEALTAVGGDDETRTARDVAIQRLVAEVLGTAASLREAFERESRKLEGELTARVAAERRQMAAELERMEARAGDLQTNLHGAGEELEAELQAERTARWLAEAELARERQRSGATDLETERAVRHRLEEELAALRGELERVRRLADEQTVRTGEARAVIADLASAAERLREQSAPLADAEDAQPPDAEPPASGATELLRPRLAAGLQRSSEAWLAGALTRLAEREDDVAARLVVALLPVQGLRVSSDLVYDLTVTGLGIYRVTLHDGTVTVEPREEPGRRREVAFRLEGTAAALAGLAAGGIRRRPRETRLEGRGRKLKRLIKAMSEPIALVDLEHANVVVDPGLLLAALVAGIDLEWTADQDFTVAWVVDGEHGGTWTVRIADGSAEVLDGPPGDGATATVHVPAPLLLPLLAGAGAPAGEQAAVSGDAGSVALLRQWFDRAQGLA